MRRSLLFLPGNNPNMLMNGGVFGADMLIFDLEDAVSPDKKDEARTLVRHALGALDYGRCEVGIRINEINDNGLWMKDLDEMIPLNPHFIMPVKVSGAKAVIQISAYMELTETKNKIPRGTIKLIPLIETCIGLEHAYQIAGSDPRVIGMLLGAEDLTADMHCARTKQGDEISYARARMVTAARAAGIEVYDTPFTDVYDDNGVADDAAKSKAMGFTGKAAISPRHIAVINRIFSPAGEEIEYAREVLAAIDAAKRQGKGAIALRGRMIDAPIVTRAMQVLEMAGITDGGQFE